MLNRSEFVHDQLIVPYSVWLTWQESLAATYGAGISNACVVDIGAKVTSIACVDEGMVIYDSRFVIVIDLKA